MSQEKKLKKVETFISPAGFIEQHWRGRQTLDDVLHGLKELERYVNRAAKTQSDSVLILVDLNGLTKVDLSRRMLEARKTGVKLMRQLEYKRAALYGPLPIQLMVKTLALIAGTHRKIRVFEKRHQALKWLCAKQPQKVSDG